MTSPRPATPEKFSKVKCEGVTGIAVLHVGRNVPGQTDYDFFACPEPLRSEIVHAANALPALEAERDRYKAALEAIKAIPDHLRPMAGSPMDDVLSLARAALSQSTEREGA